MTTLYALIQYGSQVPGHRPATRLAKIEPPHVWTELRHAWQKETLQVHDVTVYCAWESYPPAREVRQMKRQLRKTPARQDERDVL